MAARLLQRLAGAMAALLLAAPAGALAKDRPPAAKDLPGVAPGQPVASRGAPPPPEPEPMQENGDRRSWRVGNWDVTVSGSVSYQIGFGRDIPER